MDYKEEFIQFMVRSNVLIFGDFVTKSGRKTPYFINTGNYQTGEQIYQLGHFYARCLIEHLGTNFDVLYGPAYKGIPLAVTTAAALYQNHGFNVPYSFNRKELKDHGEGGGIIGHQPRDGERVVIVEDVVTAGTSVRESLELLSSLAKVEIVGLVVSVNRRERGTGAMSALKELEEVHRIKVHPIVSIDEIIQFLHNRSIDGKVYLTDEVKQQTEQYLKQYGVED